MGPAPKFLAMVPPRKGEYPKKKCGVCIVGEVEFYINTGASTSHGRFKVTADMLEALWELKRKSESLLEPDLF